jgi:hypothetical protein
VHGVLGVAVGPELGFDVFVSQQAHFFREVFAMRAKYAAVEWDGWEERERCWFEGGGRGAQGAREGAEEGCGTNDRAETMIMYRRIDKGEMQGSG